MNQLLLKRIKVKQLQRFCCQLLYESLNHLNYMMEDIQNCYFSVD